MRKFEREIYKLYPKKTTTYIVLLLIQILRRLFVYEIRHKKLSELEDLKVEYSWVLENNKCQFFTGCTAYTKSSYDECYKISKTYISDSSQCIDIRECSEYITVNNLIFIENHVNEINNKILVRISPPVLIFQQIFINLMNIVTISCLIVIKNQCINVFYKTNNLKEFRMRMINELNYQKIVQTIHLKINANQQHLENIVNVQMEFVKKNYVNNQCLIVQQIKKEDQDQDRFGCQKNEGCNAIKKKEVKQIRILKVYNVDGIVDALKKTCENVSKQITTHQECEYCLFNCTTNNGIEKTYENAPNIIKKDGGSNKNDSFSKATIEIALYQRYLWN
ncbi:unnamed protein product [Paramecium sonneborni]|uniref:Transmembrane protein n=1 Tax=Paramecium sonneborni TaxID=65129 RepID=A0A8S1RDX4_9CILI|nr:unnamed protein product [Paramecium sonneborni]